MATTTWYSVSPLRIALERKLGQRVYQMWKRNGYWWVKLHDGYGYHVDTVSDALQVDTPKKEPF